MGFEHAQILFNTDRYRLWYRYNTYIAFPLFREINLQMTYVKL